MFPKSVPILALAAAAVVAGCGRRPPPSAAAPPAAATKADYTGSPEVQKVRLANGAPTLEGSAAPQAVVRLAMPAGTAFTTRADASGRWRLALPAAPEPRIFGLSQRTGGRLVQAQGYVLVGPRGKAALLRAGGGARRLDPAAGPRLGAVDFDRDGAAIVSGAAPARAWISLRLDGRQAAEARADAGGHFDVALTRLAPGAHALEVLGDGFTSAARVDITPPAPLVAGPLHSQFTKGGLRADWLTPGGGEQSTVLLD